MTISPEKIYVGTERDGRATPLRTLSEAGLQRQSKACLGAGSISGIEPHFSPAPEFLHFEAAGSFTKARKVAKEPSVPAKYVCFSVK